MGRPLFMTKPARGWIVAAPGSNSGKTLVTAALLRLLRRQGTPVTPYKVGPDYIDPGFLAAAAGETCRNLDPWAMTPGRLHQQLALSEQRFVIEGVMGLFDGAISGDGSTADLAAALRLPVVLVVNAKGQGASAAALAQGFAGFRDDVTVAGVIFTQVASPRHRKLLADACETAGIDVLGVLAADPGLTLRERHLGLVQASEREDLDDLLEHAADILGQDIDITALQTLAAPPYLAKSAAEPCLPPLGQRIAVANDIAFGFSYSHVLADWKTSGAEIHLFSPLADEAPREDTDAVYLPGGYPELHAGVLAGNRIFLDGVRQAANRGAVILGECGGYMVLGQGVEDKDGSRHAMAGLLNLETSFAKRKLHLGYRQMELCGPCPLGPDGSRFRGHEFHYANLLQETGESLFTVWDALGEQEQSVGLQANAVMGSFIHLIDAELSEGT